jgi:hypothetical protein
VPGLVAKVLERLRQMGSSVTVDEKTDLIFVNEEWTVSIVLSRYQQTEARTARWMIRLPVLPRSGPLYKRGA